MTNKTIQCTDCQIDFVFTEGEQKFFQKLVDEGKMQEYSEPKRCRSCRAKKRREAGNR